MNDSNKALYQHKSFEFKKKINELQEKSKQLEIKIQNLDKVEQQYGIIAVCIVKISIIEYLFEHNSCHNLYFNRNNDGILDNIRKEFSTLITLLGKHFGRNIPHNLSENTESLRSLSQLSSKRILNFFVKTDKLWELMKSTYGVSSRYISTIVEIYGELVRIMLNLINFRDYIQRRKDISDPEYTDINDLLTFIKSALIKASDHYIEAYNLNRAKPLLHESLIINEFTIFLFRTLNEPKESLDDLHRKQLSIERMLNL